MAVVNTVWFPQRTIEIMHQLFLTDTNHGGLLHVTMLAFCSLRFENVLEKQFH
jgi:hypothetical protein